MILTKPPAFAFDIGEVIRIVSGDFLPVVLEVTADTVFSLQFEVKLLSLLKEGGVVPGSTIQNGSEFVIIGAPRLE
jgi:hypothetical protein